MLVSLKQGRASVRIAAAFADPARTGDRWLLFALYLLLTLCRMPAVVLQGRFWAEEGRRFYFDAARYPWYHVLVKSYAGYLNLSANLAAVAARHLVPLEYGPRVTFAFALLAQAAPAILLVTSRAALLQSRLALALALFLLAAAPSAEEVWLNTLHSQFQLAVCVGLILALDPEPGWLRKFLLFLAPLYGVVSIILLPLFALRTAIDRSRARLVETLILGAGSAIQLGFFFHQVGGLQSLDLKLIFATFFAKNIVLPLLSFGGSQPIATWLHAALDRGQLPIAVMVTIVLAVALVVALLWRGPAAARWLAAASAALALVSYYGALLVTNDMVEPHLGNRYAFAPQVLFAWSLLLIAASGLGLAPRIAAFLVLWLCLASTDAYLHPAAIFAHGPDWSAEVAKWRHNPNYSPLVWPGGFWRVPMPLPAN